VSSLRPLITITLLAAVGVVLYLKINETEPVVPEGVGQWSAGPLEIGGGAEAGAVGQTTSPPAYAAEAAPPFSPGGATATPAKSAPPVGELAPSWSPETISIDPPKAVSSSNPPAATAESSPIARTAEPVVKAPEMPAIPEATVAKETAPSPDAAPAFSPATAESAPPFVNAPSVAADENKKEEAKSPADVAAAVGATAAAVAAAGNASSTSPSAPTPVKEGVASDPITPTGSSPAAANAPTPAAQYSSAKIAIQSALDRGELAQALELLSDWYDDPSLTAAESEEVHNLLSQLAGSVIYEGPPAHRLEKPYKVQAGETLHDVAAKYDVPWQLLAKINGIADPTKLAAGQELKVMRGPFSALVDLSERKMTIMLDRRYAGKFAIELDPASTIEEGQWKIDQKLLTPASGGIYGPATSASEDRSLLLSNPAIPNGQAIVVRGPGNLDPALSQPAARVIRMKAGDVNDLFDILSEKSRVTVRR
jgi:LysM repeat protein